MFGLVIMLLLGRQVVARDLTLPIADTDFGQVNLDLDQPPRRQHHRTTTQLNSPACGQQPVCLRATLTLVSRPG